ncbi:MAG: DUF1592 domain-containing protein [Verrucomicrobiota bacterium]
MTAHPKNFQPRLARFLGAVALLCPFTALNTSADDQPFDFQSIEPFLEAHCYACHDDLSSKGDLDLYNLDFNPKNKKNFKIWELVFDRVRHGEMPPEKKPRPAQDEKKAFLANLKTPLLESDRADLATNGRVNGRRLTRVQYENTLHDLLGIDIPLANQLPADETGKDFQTVADAQQLSLFHLDQYLTAADLALENAFDRIIHGDSHFQKRYGPKQLTSNPGGGNYRGPEARNGKIRAWPHGLQYTGRMPATDVPESGWYQITIKNLRAINPGPDQAVWGTLRTGACSSAEPILFYVASVEATAKPTTHTYTAWIQEDHILEFKPNEGTNRLAPSGAQGGNVSYRGRNLEKDGFSGLEFESIELKRIYPHASAQELRSKLLPGITFNDDKPVIKKPEEELRRLIGTFASRAFRRPVPKDQLTPYQELAAAKLKETGKFHKALHAGYRAILCSPRLLTFVEPPGKLDNHAVASRLSYLLWNSMPDDTLRSLADRGELLKPATLKKEVERLLNHPKSDRFIAGFSDQWLNLKEIGFTSPDRRRFRDFDPIVQDSLVQETRAFLSEIIENDLSIRNFIRSDFALLNTRLKNHYALSDDVKVTPGKGLQRVSINHPYRSGLVTQGSILKVTADGSVTSPILRGIFVNERILGLHVPPPPANVPAVEPDIRGATSIRDELSKHRSDASCAACHAKIDPAGFALESFDPVGQWRTAYGTSKDAAKVDPSGVTPEGETFADIIEWQKLYHRQPELLTKAFAEQFLTYATGASIRFSDRNQISNIVASAKEHDYGLRSIIHAAVASNIFLTK